MANIPISRGEAQILTREEKVQRCNAQLFSYLSNSVPSRNRVNPATAGF